MEKTRVVVLLIVSVVVVCGVSLGVYFGIYWYRCDCLSMEKNSASYYFTQSESSDQLAIRYLQKEQEKNEVFRCTWNYAKKQRSKGQGICNVQGPVGLKEEHFLAVIAYTVHTKECPDLSKKFNDAVRRSGGSDRDYQNFPFKSFHYLLSVALEKLRKEISGSPPQPIYRGREVRSCGKVGEKMKFGYFASSSRSNRVANEFGRDTTFTINSNYGVSIEYCSVNSSQLEVLIPPYEVFKIAACSERSDGVDIALSADDAQGIQVKVERDEQGGMRVVRSDGAPVSAGAGLCILALLRPLCV